MRGIMIAVFLVVLAGCSSVPPPFMPVGPIPANEFTHAPFDKVLATHVREGVVDYQAIQTDDRFSLYVSLLDRIDPSAFETRDERLAFWVNAYNAFAIKGILDGQSPMTLIGRYHYFIGTTYRVGGTAIDLYDLERKILVEQFHEPLIHFAIVCASASCPKLQPWAYRPDQLACQFDRAARAFINDPTRNRFDRTGRVAFLSRVFEWFESDFILAGGSVLAYIANYVDDAELADELVRHQYRIEYLDYDWSLNGIPPRR